MSAHFPVDTLAGYISGISPDNHIGEEAPFDVDVDVDDDDDDDDFGHSEHLVSREAKWKGWLTTTPKIRVHGPTIVHSYTFKKLSFKGDGYRFGIFADDDQIITALNDLGQSSAVFGIRQKAAAHFEVLWIETYKFWTNDQNRLEPETWLVGHNCGRPQT